MCNHCAEASPTSLQPQSMPKKGIILAARAALSHGSNVDMSILFKLPVFEKSISNKETTLSFFFFWNNLLAAHADMYLRYAYMLYLSRAELMTEPRLRKSPLKFPSLCVVASEPGDSTDHMYGNFPWELDLGWSSIRLATPYTAATTNVLHSILDRFCMAFRQTSPSLAICKLNVYCCCFFP